MNRRLIAIVCVLFTFTALVFAQAENKEVSSEITVEESVDKKAAEKAAKEAAAAEAKAAKEAEKAAALEAKQKAKEEALAAKTAAAEEKARQKEEAAAAKLAAKESDSNEVKSAPVRIGGYGQVQPVVGALSEYIKLNAGGGIAVEVGLPLDSKVEAGFSAGGAFYTNPVKVDTLKSVMNVQIYGGVYCSVPFAESGFSFRPELDYGVALFFAKPSDLVGSDGLKSCYADQIITANLGFRYFNPVMAKGRLEFELAPNVSVTTEKGSAGVFAGGRIGIFYRVNGIDAVVSEEKLAKKEAKAQAKAEKAAAEAELKAQKAAAKNAKNEVAVD